MEQTYRMSRIPQHDTYFQRLPKELHELISLYDYDCNFDVTFKPIEENEIGTLEFRFRDNTQTVLLDLWAYSDVNIQTFDPVSRECNTIHFTDTRYVVEALLREVQKGLNVTLSIGRKDRIIFENSKTHPHIFTILSERDDQSDDESEEDDDSVLINDIPLCRQLVSALLEIYPPE